MQRVCRLDASTAFSVPGEHVFFSLTSAQDEGLAAPARLFKPDGVVRMRTALNNEPSAHTSEHIFNGTPKMQSRRRQKISSLAEGSSNVKASLDGGAAWCCAPCLAPLTTALLCRSSVWRHDSGSRCVPSSRQHGKQTPRGEWSALCRLEAA